MAEEATLLLTVLAGSAAFLSACTLPLIPPALALAAALAARRPVGRGKASVWPHLLLFAAGFIVLFALSGATGAAAGQLARARLGGLQAVGGATLALFALALLAGERLPRSAAVAGAALTGAALASAWTPCIGPTLATALLLAGTPGTVGEGVVRLALFGAGLMAPLVLLGAMLARVAARRPRAPRARSAVLLGLVALLVASGTLLAIGRMAALTAALSRYAPVVAPGL